MGLGKVSQDDFIPVARFNALASAITVKADAPWNTIEEFLAAAKRSPGNIKVGNSGVGSIWHLAAAVVAEKTGVQFSYIPFQRGNPAVLALLGGHVDAVTVSTAEVLTCVASSKLKVLAVMADKRLNSYEAVPTFKERNIDVSVGSWAGLGVPKGTPANVVHMLKVAALKSMSEPVLMGAMDKMNLNAAFADDVAFKAQMVKDSETFRVLLDSLKLNN